MTGTAIARRLGLSHSFVYDLFNDPDGSKTRARKAGYAGVCVDCGAPTSGCDGRREEPRCAPCANTKSGDERRLWTRDLIVARVREWNELHNEPPAMPDWNPTKARLMGDDARARRFEAACSYWPWATVVVYTFGTWNAGIRAAGLSPRPRFGVAENAARRRGVRRGKAAA